MNNFHFNDNNGNLNSKDEEKYEDHSTLETPSNFNKIKSPFQLSLGNIILLKLVTNVTII